MAAIYYWSFSDKSSCGHLSLELDDGTYLSFWPSKPVEGMLENVKGTFIKDFETDKKYEGRDPDEIALIPEDVINVSKVKAFVKKVKQQGAEYQFLSSNCAQMIQKALTEGGMSLPVVDLSVSITPYQVIEWARQCKQTQRGKIRIGNFFSGMFGN